MPNNNHLSKNFAVSSVARGQRVESLRGLTHLSRREFRNRYAIPASTLQYWEEGTGNGLTEKGARKLIAALKADGILCTLEWLMYGVGQGPQMLSNAFFVSGNIIEEAIKTPLIKTTEDEQNALIMAELLLFKQHYPKTALDLIVQDDGMAPRFVPGEYVAGIKRQQEAINKLIGYDCIVQTEKGETLLRTLKKSEQPNRFHLLCSNPNTTVEHAILYNVELLSAAPVIWTRRKDKED